MVKPSPWQPGRPRPRCHGATRSRRGHLGLGQHAPGQRRGGLGGFQVGDDSWWRFRGRFPGGVMNLDGFGGFHGMFSHLWGIYGYFPINIMIYGYL